MSARAGLIYFFKAGEFVKIGWSRDPEKRAKQLQTGAAVPLEYVGSLYGTKATEAEIHRRFDSARSHGEWFRWTPEIAAFTHAFCGGRHTKHAQHEAWARNIVDTLLLALHAVKLQPPPDPSDPLGGREAHRVLLGILFEVFEFARGLSKAADNRETYRVSVYGEGAGPGIDLPSRPTAEQVEKSLADAEAAILGAAFKSREERIAAQAARRDSTPAEYLDRRAIFDDMETPADIAQATLLALHALGGAA